MRARLRTRLLLLIAGTAVPLLALAAVLAYLLLEYERETFRQGAIGRNRAFISAVDAEIRGHIQALSALATSAALQQGDLRTFQEDAIRVASSQPDWMGVILIDTNGNQLVNTGHPFGSPGLGRPNETESFEHVLRTGAPTVGLVTKGSRGLYAVPVRVPVKDGGRVRYVLTAPVKPQAFQRLLDAQHFPSTWAAGLLDESEHFVARIPSRAPGDSASDDFTAAVRRASEGWFRGRTLEGADTFTAHRTSDFSKWTVGVAIPASDFYGAAYRTGVYMGFGALLSVLLAVGFAYRVGSRIARPIASLATAARALGQKRAIMAPDVESIDEVHEVARALDEARDAIRERESLRDREERALKMADKAKDEFLAMLGHELRNPLSAITASAQVLRLAKPGDASAVKAHHVIDRQTRQMTRLVEDLLDVSRLAVGKVALHPERFDLGEFAERVVHTWREGRRTPREVRLRLAPVWVDADRGRVEQIVTNLLDNADKFSLRHEAIEVRVVQDAGDAVLEVWDWGQGIAPELLGAIFEAFVQAPQDFARARGGLGLGLTLVKRLTEMHGGKVTAHSDGVGKGACFTVRLPAIPAPEGEPVEHRPRASRGQARRILVVEDNDDGRAMLEAMLTLEGHDVHSVPNGVSAVAAARNWKPDVALLDIGLPDIDGYEVARRLRAAGLGARLKLVAVSGYGQSDDELRAYQAGFDMHLTKPVSPDFLRDVLAALAPAEPDRASDD
jgi:signal transduction histidine kinase/ActR/RegA family two-component response regulator